MLAGCTDSLLGETPEYITEKVDLVSPYRWSPLNLIDSLPILAYSIPAHHVRGGLGCQGQESEPPVHGS